MRKNIRMAYITSKLIVDKVAENDTFSAEMQELVDSNRATIMDLLSTHRVPKEVVNIWDSEAALLKKEPAIWFMYFGDIDI